MFHESLPVFVNTFVTQLVIKLLETSEATHVEETKFWRLYSNRNMIQQFYFTSRKWSN